MAFADVEHEDVGEVEETGLEDAHDLESAGWLSAEGYGAGGEDVAEETAHSGGEELDGVGGGCGDVVEVVEGFVGGVDAFGHEYVVGTWGGFAFLAQDGGGGYLDDDVVEVAYEGVDVLVGEGVLPVLLVEVGGVGVIVYGLEVGTAKALSLGVPAFGLEGGEGDDEAIDGGGFEGEAHGDVEVVWGVGALVGYGVEDGFELVFVA